MDPQSALRVCKGRMAELQREAANERLAAQAQRSLPVGKPHNPWAASLRVLRWFAWPQLIPPPAGGPLLPRSF